MLAALNDDAVDLIFKKLDESLLADEGYRQFSAFQRLFHLKRPDDCGILDFITKFEHLVFAFKTEDMELPDTVMAFMLLPLCRLKLRLHERFCKVQIAWLE